ncbi:MAG: hypothetical protein WDN28_10255 [Chthoniobacter sp.]
MKIRLLFLIAVLPLFCAASFTRPVWGTLKFGMTELAAKEAIARYSRQSPNAFTATSLRQTFITSTIKIPGKRMASDQKVEIRVDFTASPVVKEIIFRTMGSTEEGYVLVAGEAWRDFQDICDSKFTRVSKNRGLSSPKVEDFAAQSQQEIVTDEWEAEGVHVKLQVRRVEKANLTEPAAARAVLCRAEGHGNQSAHLEVTALEHEQ